MIGNCQMKTEINLLHSLDRQNLKLHHLKNWTNSITVAFYVLIHFTEHFANVHKVIISYKLTKFGWIFGIFAELNEWIKVCGFYNWFSVFYRV